MKKGGLGFMTGSDSDYEAQKGLGRLKKPQRFQKLLVESKVDRLLRKTREAYKQQSSS